MQKEKNHVPEIASGGLLNQALRHTPAIKYAIAVAAIAITIIAIANLIAWNELTPASASFS